MKVEFRAWRRWQIDAAGMAVCLAMTLAFYFGGLSPVLQHRQQLGAQRSLLAERRATIAAVESKLASKDSQVEILKKALAKATVQLEPVSSTNQRLGLLSSLASQSGLKIDEVQPGQPSSQTHYDEVPIRLEGSGTYRTCLTFLHRLRERFADTSVRSFELTANRSDPNNAGTFRLNLRWYAASAVSASSK